MNVEWICSRHAAVEPAPLERQDPSWARIVLAIGTFGGSALGNRWARRYGKPRCPHCSRRLQPLEVE